MVRDVIGVICRTRGEPHMPVSGGRDLWSVGLVSGDETSEQAARLLRSFHAQQEVPYHGHRVRAEDQSLNIRKVEPHPSASRRSATGR